MFWFFGHEAYGLLAPRPGIKPAPPALEGKVLTAGLPGKPLLCSLRCFIDTHFPVLQTHTSYMSMQKEDGKT